MYTQYKNRVQSNQNMFKNSAQQNTSDKIQTGFINRNFHKSKIVPNYRNNGYNNKNRENGFGNNLENMVYSMIKNML